MKKNVLALSIAAMIGGLGFAGAASAAVLGTVTATANATNLVVNEGGVGHMLLVPYFNTQSGNMSVFHIVNTDQVNGKAVKVRFRSAANSDDLLDFQLFLSPGDVWTGAVSAGADGVTELVTADNTCTVPALGKGVAEKFITTRLNASANVPNQTREGYVEIFNMANIPFDAAPNSLYQVTKHKSGVAPCSVAGSFANATLTTIATTDFATGPAAAAAGFDVPSGGLMADWYIINVPETTTFSGAATAVVAESTPGVSGRGNFVHFPQVATAVANPAIKSFTADPLFRDDSTNAAGAVTGVAAIAAASYDLPDMSTPYLAGNTNDPIEQAAQLTQALNVKSITNQYANDVSITAKTDWVFSMPTRRYSVAANYPAPTASPNYRLFTKLIGATPGVEWFTPALTPVRDGNICVEALSQRFFDREETTAGATAPGPVFSPKRPDVAPTTEFCGEVSVLKFNVQADDVSVLNASVARQGVMAGYVNGWSVINTTKNGVGLPVVGSAFMKLSNDRVKPGMAGTFGITWPHRFTR